MQGLLDRVIEAITQYGAWGVFVIAFLEEVIAPIPSTLTIMAAGFVLLSPYSTFWEALFPAILYIAIPTSLGMVLGGLIIYALGYYGGKAIIDRWGKWFGLSWSSVEKMQKYFERGHGDEMVLVGLRVIPIFPNSLISGVCGVLRYPLKPFIILSFLGGIPRALLMAMLGWWAENTYRVYGEALSGVESWVVGFGGLIGVILLISLIVKKKKNENS